MSRTCVPEKIRFILLPFLVLSILGAGCDKPILPPLNEEVLKNLTYPTASYTQSATVELKDGKSVLPFSGSAILTDYAIGDLDKDGSPEALAVIYINNGGTGNWPVIYIVKYADGMPITLDSKTFQLEDRDRVKSITIQDGLATFDLTVHGPGDPSCCPSMDEIRKFRLQEGDLVEVGMEE